MSWRLAPRYGKQLVKNETRTSYPAFCTAANGNCRHLLPPGVVNVVNGAGGVFAGRISGDFECIAGAVFTAQWGGSNKLCNTQRKTLFR